MEKEKISTAEPLQGSHNDVKGALERALGVEAEQVYKPAGISKHRTWKFPAKRKIHYRHRKLFKDGSAPEPEKLEHIPHGYKKGCVCEKCMVEHGWFEDVNTAAQISSDTVHAEKSNSVSDTSHVGDVVREVVEDDEDDLMKELVDEELAGVTLDSVREFTQLLMRGRGIDEDVLKIWEKDSKEVAILGRAGKKVWDKYAPQIKIKHREAFMLAFIVGKGWLIRLWATSVLMKSKGKK